MALQHLLLMRHAKSSWISGDLSDHQRPLNKRGQGAAKNIGSVLRARNLSPDLVWSSDSMRTRETFAHFTHGFETPQVVWLKDFYLAPTNRVLYICEHNGEPDADRLMLLGHNPGWEDLLFHFSGLSHPMPTANCAIFARQDEEGDWLQRETWRLVDILRARDYKT